MKKTFLFDSALLDEEDPNNEHYQSTFVNVTGNNEREIFKWVKSKINEYLLKNKEAYVIFKLNDFSFNSFLSDFSNLIHSVQAPLEHVFMNSVNGALAGEHMIRLVGWILNYEVININFSKNNFNKFATSSNVGPNNIANPSGNNATQNQGGSGSVNKSYSHFSFLTEMIQFYAQHIIVKSALTGQKSARGLVLRTREATTSLSHTLSTTYALQKK